MSAAEDFKSNPIGSVIAGLVGVAMMVTVTNACQNRAKPTPVTSPTPSANVSPAPSALAPGAVGKVPGLPYRPTPTVTSYKVPPYIPPTTSDYYERQQERWEREAQERRLGELERKQRELENCRLVGCPY